MRSIAIIGSGIAGLGCAWSLQDHAEITLFEKNDYAGGHTNTVVVQDGAREVPFDTGFMVYNEVTYPHLTRLFSELEVETYPTSMSFSVQHQPTGLEYCGSSWSLIFAQRSNLLRPAFLRLLSSISRFNQEASLALGTDEIRSLTLSEYVRLKRYGDDFLERYLLPMSCAVWSAPFDEMLRFPAETLLRFFHNHGFLGMYTQHPWRTVTGGARNYVSRLTEGFASRIHRDKPVIGVARNRSGVELRFRDGGRMLFDDVVLACHADESLALLDEPTPLERKLLTPFRYQPNLATIHTDESVMPRSRRAWASWNYRIERQGEESASGSTIYWMNSLQRLPAVRNFFVSINGADSIDPSRVIRTIDYQHPIFSLAAIDAQKELPLLNEQGATFFCGSYFGYGFHEDGLVSGLNAASAVLKREERAA